MEGSSDWGTRPPGGAMGLSTEDKGRLLSWLKGNAEEMARDLRDAGWEEDGSGLWSLGAFRRLHLYNAHEIATRDATLSDHCR